MRMHYQSFHTAQNAVHPSLTKEVIKHAENKFLRPIPSHQEDAFEEIKAFLKKRERPLIIDSGCGTGQSSLALAEKYSDHCVIGIDKSIARLKRASFKKPDHLLLVRGDLIDLWRLFERACLPITRHYLFFPNPWPKIGHLKRRFHGHPIFNTMISLAPYFEMRTNWHIYAEECYLALKILNRQPSLSLKTDQEALSLFEKKYLMSSCPIYIVKFDEQAKNH